MNINALIDMLIKRNPNIVNNPQAQNMLEIIRSNNSEAGEQIANNLCQTYGISKEEALQQAKVFFNI